MSGYTAAKIRYFNVKSLFDRPTNTSTKIWGYTIRKRLSSFYKIRSMSTTKTNSSQHKSPPWKHSKMPFKQRLLFRTMIKILPSSMLYHRKRWIPSKLMLQSHASLTELIRWTTSSLLTFFYKFHIYFLNVVMNSFFK